MTGGIADAYRTLSSLNQAPTATSATVTLPNSGESTVTLAGSDDQTAQANLVYTVTSLPSQGSLLKPDGTPVQVGDTFTGGPASLTYRLPTVTFGSLSTSFQFTVTDDGTPTGTPRTSSPATVTINTPSGSTGIVRVGGTSANDSIVVGTSTDHSTLQVTVNGTLVSSTIPMSLDHPGPRLRSSR